MSQPFILHGAIRSSAAWRVRIVLHLKGLAFEERFLDLNRGEHQRMEYRKVNPQMLVPALVAPDGTLVTQSMAIMEYLDETAPGPRVLPADAAGRARVRSLSQMVACDIHPINNLRVRNHVLDLMAHDSGAQSAWMDKWLSAGLDALEARLAEDRETGAFCHGKSPTMADACLVPQLNNARATNRELSDWPNILRIAASCEKLAAFAETSPAKLQGRESGR